MIQVIIIFLLFAFIHSITVSKKMKKVCADFFGETFMRVCYRALYNAISCITAGTAFYLIDQVPDRHLWTAPVWLQWILHAIQFAGVVFGSLAFRHLDTGEFLGLRQIARYWKRGEAEGNIEGLTQNELVTAGVYGIVRHPMYLAGIVIFTFNPHLTRNSLTISGLADLYFLFGAFIEERRFIGIFGDQYRAYRKRVPRLIPGILHR
jgi:protein-S-isoprenylcysteine O-methyltransferase Ste14